MSYYKYEVTDFLEDDYFKEWVYAPNPENISFWKDFIKEYPEKSEMIANAQSILISLLKDIENEFPSDEKVESLLLLIQDRRNTSSLLSKKYLYRIGISLTAAMAILIIGWVIKVRSTCSSISYQDLISAESTPLLERSNSTSKCMLVMLPDSSTIMLHPNSSISYKKDFNASSKREVYLSGEAFFNVTKNPERPFFVYSNELITKVLGTSFTVKAFENDKQVEVVVKTGKVSVFTRLDNDANINKSNSELGGVIITPNQKILFSREEIRIKKSLVESPEIIASAVLPAPMLKFQDMSVSQIFTNLEETYGIDMVYDEELLGHCLLTASFTNENLYEKIDLICKGIEANFEVVDARVVISGRGCHQE